ncbi:CBP4-domain-containing protein [Canariomyces notabilis]|uniref:Cytochrome b mRNA-processing protein 4 n=1 Tax=Canariomyces notabilis TaxID=2074819 RepID=A0AAN6T9G3_9PEZI|nr:CBP4-domain-containing protein [Canariomyces arenarius]
MAKKPVNWWLWTKLFVVGGAIMVGGPALTMWLTPTDEELFQKYNPELQKRSLERRYERQKEFDDFVTKLKEYSKSDKPIWAVQAEAEKEREKQASIAETVKMAEEIKARREAMRKEAGLPAQPDSSASGNR